MTERKNREGLTWDEWAAATGKAVLSTPEYEAWLAGEDPTEWKVEGPIRWVITYFCTRHGYRTLTEPGQGRYTYATQKEAEERMRLFEPSLREKVLKEEASTLAVVPVECWPGHHDPKKTVFSAVDLIRAIFWEPERQFEEYLREKLEEQKHLNLDPPGSSFASAQAHPDPTKEKP